MDADYFGNVQNLEPVVFSMKTFFSYSGFLMCCCGCFADFGSESANACFHWIFKISVLILMEYLVYTPLRSFRPSRIMQCISFSYLKRYYRGLTLATTAVRDC